MSRAAMAVSAAVKDLGARSAKRKGAKATAAAPRAPRKGSPVLINTEAGQKLVLKALDALTSMTAEEVVEAGALRARILARLP